MRNSAQAPNRMGRARIKSPFSSHFGKLHHELRMKLNCRKFLKTTLVTVALAAVAPQDVLAQTLADIPSLTLAAAANLVRKKSVSPVELTQACLKRRERPNPILNTRHAVGLDGVKQHVLGVRQTYPNLCLTIELDISDK